MHRAQPQHIQSNAGGLRTAQITSPYNCTSSFQHLKYKLHLQSRRADNTATTALRWACSLFSEVILIKRLMDHPAHTVVCRTPSTLLIGRSTLQTWISGEGKEKKKVFKSLHCAVFYTKETATIKQSWEAAPKTAPEADFQAVPTMKGGGGRLESKLFQQIIGGRANVFFGKWTVSLSKAKTIEN